MKVSAISNNGFGSKIMVTPGAKSSVGHNVIIEGKFYKHLAELQNNGAQDTVLIGRKLNSPSIVMKVYEIKDNYLRANKSWEIVDFDGFWDLAYRVKPVYEKAKMWVRDTVPNFCIPELAKYHMDRWIKGENPRIIITSAAMDKFGYLSRENPAIINKFLSEATEIESNGIEDKLLIDVGGECDNTRLLLYLYKNINGIMRESSPERFYSKMEVVPERSLGESYYLVSRNIQIGSEEYWSKYFSPQFNVVQ